MVGRRRDHPGHAGHDRGLRTPGHRPHVRPWECDPAGTVVAPAMVELDRVFFDEMVEHGLAAFPNEACGLLAGKEGRPVKFFAITNQDASSSTYRFDSKEQYLAQTEIDDQG